APLFPYTTLFRSEGGAARAARRAADGAAGGRRGCGALLARRRSLERAGPGVEGARRAVVRADDRDGTGRPPRRRAAGAPVRRGGRVVAHPRGLRGDPSGRRRRLADLGRAALVARGPGRALWRDR